MSTVVTDKLAEWSADQINEWSARRQRGKDDPDREMVWTLPEWLAMALRSPAGIDALTGDETIREGILTQIWKKRQAECLHINQAFGHKLCMRCGATLGDADD